MTTTHEINPDDADEATDLAIISSIGQDVRIFRRGAHIYTQIENYGEHDMEPIVLEDVFEANPHGFVNALRAAANGILEMIEEVGVEESSSILGPDPGEISHYHVGERGSGCQPHAHVGGGVEHDHAEPEWQVGYRWQMRKPEWGVDWPEHDA